MNSTKLPYDKTSRESIVKYAENLLGKTLRKVLGTHIRQTYSGKGRLGQLLEKLYFQYDLNSVSMPDFPEAGLELKTTPLKQTKNGLKSKERLVLNIINYLQEHKNTFEDSSFWKKNARLLLMFYMHKDNVADIDLVFKIVRQWDFPPEDLKIIKDDWHKIVNKIKNKQAHELSEGDTLYLGACTKGGKGTPLRQQYGTSQRAKQRAFSLKSKYINFIIDDSLGKIKKTGEVEAVVKNVSGYVDHETFEEHVINKFSPYYGKLVSEIEHIFNINTFSKAKLYILAKAILGVHGKKIEEFEKADIKMKTIRFEKNGTLKESMSFAQIKYEEIIQEGWETSYWRNTLIKRFFFVVFQKNHQAKLELKKVMFWGMPVKDLEIAKKFWLHTKKNIQEEDFKHFSKISDNKLCHVRPKGRNSLDLMRTSSGQFEKKMCYWLNSSYIKKIILQDDVALNSLSRKSKGVDFFLSDVIPEATIEQGYLPVYDLKAVATVFEEQITPSIKGWKHIPNKLYLKNNMFIAQVVGKSMETTIPDGSYCIFRFDQGGSRNGKVVLVESRQVADLETNQKFTVKRYRSEKEDLGDGQWRHKKIVLSPDNKAFEDIILENVTEDDFRVVAEFIAVVA